MVCCMGRRFVGSPAADDGQVRAVVVPCLGEDLAHGVPDVAHNPAVVDTGETPQKKQKVSPNIPIIHVFLGIGAKLQGALLYLPS